jgi:hypothetical protein
VLKHIALTITDSREIGNFYEEILNFRIKYKFTMSSDLTRKIFDEDNPTDVYVLGQQDLEFEVFISLKKETRVFSHICLTYQNPEIIYENALKSGYKTIIKEGVNHSTGFIWDKSGNMFEIKI